MLNLSRKGFEIDLRDRRHFLSYLHPVHVGDFGNLKSVLIEKGYIEQKFEVFILVVPDIGFGALGLDNMVALFPYANGMGLYAGKFFQIFY